MPPQPSVVVEPYPIYTPTTTEPKYGKPPPDDDEPPPKRSRRTMILSAIGLVVALGIGTLIFLGSINSGNYYLVCQPEQVLAEQGRGFPPWGAREISGAEWKPIAIPPQAECKPRETEDADELAGWYLDLLVGQASDLLTAREVTKVDLADAQLKQALLLARSPAKRDQRKDIERLLGDVEYWRALGVLRDATAKLGDAAKQFESAAAQRPRHVSDASAWAAYLRKVADELSQAAKPGSAAAGAHGSVVPSSATSPDHPTAPNGVALPVEPVPAAEPPAPAPDAGVPSGGVLL